MLDLHCYVDSTKIEYDMRIRLELRVHSKLRVTCMYEKQCEVTQTNMDTSQLASGTCEQWTNGAR